MSDFTAPPIPRHGRTVNVPYLRSRGRKGYPLDGIKTGPAWDAMWSALAGEPETWFVSRDLGEIGARAGDCHVITATTILVRAANSGLIEREYRPVETGRGTRRMAFYRAAR